jgi:hypothetical protein
MSLVSLVETSHAALPDAVKHVSRRGDCVERGYVVGSASERSEARVEGEPIDVVMLTKNSIKPCLRKSLDSIYRNIPVRRLIVVDNGSRDGTIDLVKSYPRSEVVENPLGNIASSRQLGIEAAETRWFAFIDSDIVLCEGWFQEISRHVSDGVGAIFGATLPMELHVHNSAAALARLKRTTVIRLQASQRRLPPGDTLFNLRALKGIAIPNDLFTAEDEFIMKFIASRGFRLVRLEDAYCYHFTHLPGSPSGIVAYGRFVHRYRLKTPLRILAAAVYAVPSSMGILVFTGDWVAFRRQILLQVLPLIGWLTYRGRVTGQG